MDEDNADKDPKEAVSQLVHSLKQLSYIGVLKLDMVPENVLRTSLKNTVDEVCIRKTLDDRSQKQRLAENALEISLSQIEKHKLSKDGVRRFLRLDAYSKALYLEKASSRCGDF